MTLEQMEREMLAQPIHSLQYMQQRLALRDPSLPTVGVTGVFDERTLEALMRFQRNFHPPVTGVVDQGTWDALLRTWRRSEQSDGEPRSVRVLPRGGVELNLGSRPSTP